MYVSATSFAVCCSLSPLATLRTVQVQCREPGLTRFPSARGDNVDTISVLKQHGEAQPSGFTFIAMESSPGSPS